MINQPVCVVCDDFQTAWLEVVRQLMSSYWEVRNLIVQIKKPDMFDQTFHDRIKSFAQAQRILGPKHVAYTLFPHRLYKGRGKAAKLFEAYNKPRGLFDKLQYLKPGGWGTYFRRMTSYEVGRGTVNQLDNIIKAIGTRNNICKAAYTIVIQKPGGESILARGGPCLNYIAVQAEPGQEGRPLTVGLLAVYRNHDFLNRAYGNYWGLCNLLMFIANEVSGSPGPLTCVSSHAYVAAKKRVLKQLVGGF